MATLLTTSYKLLASVKSSTYSTFRLYGKYEAQSVETNETTITLQTRIYGNGGKGSFDSGTSKINSTSKKLGSTSYAKGKETVLQTLTYDVPHSSTGTYENKTVTASLTTSASPEGSIETQISLPTIPRASKYTVSNYFPSIGENVTISIQKKNDTFIHSLSWKTADGELSGVIATKTSEPNVVWTVPEELYDLIPNTDRITVRILLTTYNAEGTTQIGNVYGEESGVIATVNRELYKPDFTYTITETNEKISAITSKLVLNASKPKFNIVATGKKGASIKSIVVTNNDGQSYSGNEVTFKEVGTPIFTITVTDSRGIPNISILDFTNSSIAYIQPNIKVVDIVRKAPTSGEIILNANGSFFNKNIDTTPNALEIKYRFKENVTTATWSELKTLPNSEFYYDNEKNTYSISDYNLGGITLYNKNYVFEFYYNDILISSATPTTRNILKGITTFDYGEHDLQVNGDLFVANENRKNKVNILETINNILDKIKDNSWVIATLSSSFIQYGSGSIPEYRKIGKTVEIRGAVKPKSAIPSNGSATIFTLPVGYRPTQNIYAICQGSGRNVWLLTIYVNGEVVMSRYGTNAYAQAPTSAWLPFHTIFTID